jgi:hypothetical protein
LADEFKRVLLFGAGWWNVRGNFVFSALRFSPFQLSQEINVPAIFCEAGCTKKKLNI